MSLEEMNNLSWKIAAGEASESEIKGYNKCNEDIKRRGLEWADHMASLRWKCTGVDEGFTRGYATRIYEEYC